jgi:ribosome biogenesis GTPase
MDFLEMEAEHLGGCFREIHHYSADCRFRGCMHQREPDCSVLEAVEQGEIAKSRYEHYIMFLSEMKERKRRY